MKSNVSIDQKTGVSEVGDKEDSDVWAEVSKRMKSCIEMEKSVGGAGLDVLII